MDDPYVYAMLALSKTNYYKDEIPGMIKALDINRLFYICKEHELAGLVGNRIIKFSSIELPQKWRDHVLKQKSKLSFFKHQTINIANVFAREGIKVVVLKNGGIMLNLINDPVDCPMDDIDTLICKSDFLNAHEILIREGFKLNFRSSYEINDVRKAFIHGSAEYSYDMPDGNKMWFELSWRPVDGRWLCAEFEPSVDEFMCRAKKANGSEAYVLSVEDNLLQVCLHTAKHSYVRAPGLRLHLDVERIVSSCYVDWNLFFNNVERYHARTSSYYSLLIAKELFDLRQIPDSLLNELMPVRIKRRAIERSLNKVGLLHPHSKKFTKLKYILFQVYLYDSLKDILKKIFPSPSFLFNRMGDNYHPVLLPLYWLCYSLDLLGIKMDGRKLDLR
jgi:hypothetical protein